MSATQVIVLPGGGYAVHAPWEGAPVAAWLTRLGYGASVFEYPLHTAHPGPLNALKAEIRRLRGAGADRIGVMGFSAGGHLAGMAATTATDDADRVDFAVLGYAITSLEPPTYEPAREILVGKDPSPEQLRATAVEQLVGPHTPPFFLWHTSEDVWVPPVHTYRLAAALSRHGIPHEVHLFEHGPHSLGLAVGAGEAETWTAHAAAWMRDHAPTN